MHRTFGIEKWDAPQAGAETVARELELVERQPTLLGIISDFFYTPFIRLGYWLSDKYRRISIISFVLDMAIELPLKASLRILREWVGFVRDVREKREDL